ncbi:unnamed protein product [Somion occarium]|uniref:Tubulin-specific chaperone D n=1 Tax=Somion occarium TaxID=3059160 RepID=A0ABP1E1I5_9APHY
MDDEQNEGRLYRGFERYQEFVETQNAFLFLQSSQNLDDSTKELGLLTKLSMILDEYQEQSYLLDPYLEQLVAPVVDQLNVHAQRLQPLSGDSSQGFKVGRLATLMYYYIKFRGYKTITRFFPHEITDLSVALNYLLLPGGLPQDPAQWPLRYVMLLWLSLICMLPFDLAQFDERGSVGHTASQIETVGKSHLNKAGIERDAAAILLARLYLRKDMHTSLPAFLDWCYQVIRNPAEPFSAIGCTRVLCEVTKAGSADLVQANYIALLDITRSISEHPTLLNNTIMRKLRTKLLSRIAVRLLPSTGPRTRRKGPLLSGDDEQASPSCHEEIDIDVPEQVEEIIEELFQALQDKDTVVRYSSSKGIARIAERLPKDFVEQILDNVLQSFSIHSIGMARMYEMPAIAEATWHGACLACAEMARRSLVPDSRLSELFEWMSKALYFDIRQGAHSIGSNVRDATCYVLWSLARAQSVDALAPLAEPLAQQLVTAACFDREVHIRRAASAAFQEYVGRTGLFPHGIDIIRKTDFYAVGTRRHAFLVAASEVAEHVEYRSSLLEHLISVTIRHWDPAMRELGAKSICEISKLDTSSLVLKCSERSEYLTFPDVGDIHGALLTLAELAATCHDIPELVEVRRQIFSYISRVPSNIVQSPRHELVTAAACQLIANSVSVSELKARQTASVPEWRKITDFALKSRSPTVQEAAADAMAALSKLIDCSPVVQRLIRDAKPTSPPVQQSLCRILGVLDYNAHPHGLMQAVEHLLASVDSKAPTFISNVEARKNACASIPLILANVLPNISDHISPDLSRRMYGALQAGLADYTMDERGDVGSWIRMVCIKGLADVAELFLTNAPRIPNFADYLPAKDYQRAVGGILKQGVERLDNVRQQAGHHFLRLLVLHLPDVPDIAQWRIHGESFMKELFLSGDDTVGWNEGAWIYPKAVQLLDIPAYRESLLAGLVLSASSRTDSTQRPVSSSLVNYAKTLAVSNDDPTKYSLRGLVGDLIAPASRNLLSNAIVIPALQTFNVLLEADALEPLYEDEQGLASLRSLLLAATKNAARIKNVQRILLSMRIVVNLLPVPTLRLQCVVQLPIFLAHQYPKVRGDTAEYLYLVLQSKDLGLETDEVEDILLETAWTSSDISEARDAAQQCTKVLKDSIS